MKDAIKREIKRLGRRALRRQMQRQKIELRFRKKFEKRTNLPAGQPKPSSPFKPNHFDPKHCVRNANFLASTIWHKVLSGQYEVTPAMYFEIDKPNGGKRPIMAFGFPDAALATVVMKRCRERNLKRFSASSYAYHPKRNLFDAVTEINGYAHSGKQFVVQIDFEAFFDSIPSDYLVKRMDDKEKITLTRHEKFVFSRFLYHQFAKIPDYQKNLFLRRHRGTPQGSSASLLLANLANSELDTALDNEAGKFARFADDVIAVCNTYEQAQQVERRFFEHCQKSGLSINWGKSPGTGIISSHQQEVRTYSDFVFLGYKFSEDGLAIPEKSVAKLKTRISRLLNLHLICYLKFGFNPTRSSVSPYKFDWDLLAFIYELRNSVYGGLAEQEIRDFINGGNQLRSMRGMMRFYCLVENPTAFRSLDGWLVSTTRRAMKQRHQILADRYGANCPTPSNKNLILGTWLDRGAWEQRGNPLPDPSMPSFVRAWRAARKFYYTFGLEKVRPPSYQSSTDIGKLFDY